jgi:hypothetical protein
MKKSKEPKDALHCAQLHFSFISKQSSAVVSEATVRSVFEQFGAIKDVYLKKTVFEAGEQTGYGFIHFSPDMVGIRAALRAAGTIHQVTINHVLYDSCVTRSLQSIVAPSSDAAGVSTHKKDQYGLTPPHQSLPIQQPRVSFMSTGNHHHDSSRGLFSETPFLPNRSLQRPAAWDYRSEQQLLHQRVPVEEKRTDFPHFWQNSCFSSSDDSSSSAEHTPISTFHLPKDNWNTMLPGNSSSANSGHYFSF